MNLKNKLETKGYFTNDGFVTAIEAALNTKPVAGAFLRGPAGVGKTFIAEVLCEIEEGEEFFFQCFPGTREEDLLAKLLPSEKTISGIKVVDGVALQAFKACKKGKGKVYFILDEWDKTRPSADSFLLDLLQKQRVNFNGESIRLSTEEASWLRVFITMNEERELSEHLIRRLPTIHFSHLSPVLIKEALEKSHPGHPYIPSCIILYQRCLASGMSKPATIQELRQLLDAINLLGDRADWDALVFQFITKTRENHALLKSVEGQSIRREEAEEEIRLNVEAYEIEEGEESVQEEPLPKFKLPRIIEAKKMVSIVDDTPSLIEGVTIIPDLSDAGGVFKLTDSTYDCIVGLAEAPTDDPAKIGEAGRVVGNQVILNVPIPLRDYRKADNLWGSGGEVVFIEPKATAQHVLALRRYGWKVVHYTTSEILAKTTGADLRWTPKAGAEIVVSLDSSLPRESSFAGLMAWPRRKCYDSAGCREVWRASCGEEFCGLMEEKKQPMKDEKPVVKSRPIFEPKGSRAELWSEIKRYISNLHIWYFDTEFSDKDNTGYGIAFVPDKYDLPSWSKRLQSLKNLLLFLNELVEIAGKWGFEIGVREDNSYNLIAGFDDTEGKIIYAWRYKYAKVVGDDKTVKIDKIIPAVEQKIEEVKGHINWLQEEVR